MEEQMTEAWQVGLVDVGAHAEVIPTARGAAGLALVRRSGAAMPGGMVPSDDELLERALTFSGSYVSDDGHVTIRRSSEAMGYSAARFTGRCDVCARAGLTPAAGEPLADVRAAVQFLAAHDHGDGD